MNEPKVKEQSSANELADELNYKMTCVYDDMTVVIENGIEISRVYQDNRIKFNPFELLVVPK